MKFRVDTDWWKQIFDEIYLLTDARSVCDAEITRREIDLICDLLSMKVTHRILDLCGGHGRHSLELSQRGFKRCSLLDYSAYLTARAGAVAAERGVPIHVVQGDARRTGFASNRFDRVMIMGNSLGYMEGSEGDREILAEVMRVLRPGGGFVVDVADGEQVSASFSPTAWHEIGDDIVVCRQRSMEGDRLCAREMVLSKEKGVVRDCTYGVRLYDARRLKRLLKECGGCQVDVYTDFSPHEDEGDFGFMNHRMLGVGRKPR
jgi:D-alanine-D-alanine ligase